MRKRHPRYKSVVILRGMSYTHSHSEPTISCHVVQGYTVGEQSVRSGNDLI